LLADIGKAHWDNNYTTSDTDIFASTMQSLATTTQGTYFARGWASHFYQDTYGDVAEIIDDGDSYRINCGQIDEYLRDKLKISCPINGTDNLYVVYELIRNTYNQLNGFSPSNTAIDNEIQDMCFLYHTQILLNFSGMSTAQITRMNNQFDMLAQDCYSTSRLGNTMDSNNENMDFIIAERANKAKHAQIAVIEEQAHNVAHMETVRVVDGLTELKFVIDDPEAYQDLLEQHVALLLEGTEYEQSSDN
jgi:hypothetical protein